eukprot:scaffold2294_cov106-Cylindrotheca_fusiformis.AAC.5
MKHRKDFFPLPNTRNDPTYCLRAIVQATFTLMSDDAIFLLEDVSFFTTMSSRRSEWIFGSVRSEECLLFLVKDENADMEKWW